MAVTLAGRAEALPATRPAVRLGIVLLLCPVLVLSSGIFSYIRDAGPLYYLTKAWPFLLSPLAASAIVRHRLPGVPLLLVLLLYGLVVTPVLSSVTFGAPLSATLQPTAKMAGFLVYPALFELLCLLRPTAAELRRALLVLGALTFALLWLLWLAVPVDHYSATPEGSQLFLVDPDRGPRIYAPMMFGFLLMFMVLQRLIPRPRITPVLLLAGAFATLAIIYKQKLAIASMGAVCTLSVLAAFRAHRAVLVAAFLLLAGAALVALPALDWTVGLHDLGGSLQTRLEAGALAVDFLQQAPVRWIVGAGALPQHDGLTLGEVLRFPIFYLSDLGWLGIVFEYGLIGTGLIAAAYATATVLILRHARADGPWGRAIACYPLYQWLVFTVYSAMAAPGEIMTLLAVSTFIATRPDRPTWR